MLELPTQQPPFNPSLMRAVNPRGVPATPRSVRRDPTDVIVYGVLIALGVLQIVLSRHNSDFVGDVTYLELAKSILGGKGYGFNFKPETMLPPGFPYLLAFFTLFLGTSYAVLVRTMAVFTTLGLLFAYEVLRREENRKVAAAICLLIGSSPIVFQFSTTLVFSDLPYFFTSMMLLWALTRLDLARRPWKAALWWLLCFLLVVSSVLIRSTGMALLGGVVGWLGVSLFGDRTNARKRLLLFVPLVLAGMVAQMSWMHWAVKHQFAEWPIHGYQENYLSQLRIKNGNDPELGMATWKDVLKRPVENADDRGADLWTLIARKGVAPAWYSPMSSVPIALVLLGLGATLWKTGGGISELYFLSYEAMYLFWPWNFEERFFLPVAPLACLYLWRGIKISIEAAKRSPRRIAAIGLACSAVGIATTALWGWSVQHPQPRLCVASWGLIAVACAILWTAGRAQLSHAPISAEDFSPRARAAIALVLAALFAIGLRSQLRLGTANLRFRAQDDTFYPDREAAEWIAAHSDSAAVVMARKDDIVYHYGGRRVIWFPPSSDPQLLMNGIRKYNVDYVVVVAGNDSYWSPPAEDSFALLHKTYPNSFELVQQSGNEQVYRVSPKPRSLAQNAWPVPIE